MAALRFADLARAFVVTGTRRATLGLGAVGLLGVLGLEDAAAKKKCKKKCGPCEECKHGRCKAQKAGTPCRHGRQCFANGKCVDCDVCASGCAYTSLQAAIDAAADGATIQLCPGRYTTNAEIAGKRLQLIGAGTAKGGTILQGRGDEPTAVLSITTSTVQVRHLTITGGVTTSSGGGISAGNADLTLADVRIEGNEAAHDGGGIYMDSGTTTMFDCLVFDNVAENGGGIYSDGGEVTLTSRSTVFENIASAGAGHAGGIVAVGGDVKIFGGSRVFDNTPTDCIGTTAC